MELRVGGSALPPHPLKMVEKAARVRKVTDDVLKNSTEKNSPVIFDFSFRL